jgi:hypothetical protein
MAMAQMEVMETTHSTIRALFGKPLEFPVSQAVNSLSSNFTRFCKLMFIFTLLYVFSFVYTLVILLLQNNRRYEVHIEFFY